MIPIILLDTHRHKLSMTTTFVRCVRFHFLKIVVQIAILQTTIHNTKIKFCPIFCCCCYKLKIHSSPKWKVHEFDIEHHAAAVNLRVTSIVYRSYINIPSVINLAERTKFCKSFQIILLQK